MGVFTTNRRRRRAEEEIRLNKAKHEAEVQRITAKLTEHQAAHGLLKMKFADFITADMLLAAEVRMKQSLQSETRWDFPYITSPCQCKTCREFREALEPAEPEFTCMWCASAYPDITSLEAHEAECC